MNQQARTNFASIPEELRSLNQWVIWGQNQDKPKQPSTPTNGFQHWQHHLASFDAAEAIAAEVGAGVGFAFNNQTDFFGIDLDGCINPSNGQIEPWALAIVHEVASYCEISQSWTGLKLICRGHTEANLKSLVFGEVQHGDHQQQVEFKTTSGYFALTGNVHSQLPTYPLRQVDPVELRDRALIYKRVLAYLGQTPVAIQGSGGDATTFSVACSMLHGFDLTPNEAMTLVQPWNSRCEPPWIDSDLRHKFDEADKREDGLGRPRGYLLHESDPPVLQNVLDFAASLKSRTASNESQPSDSVYTPFPVDVLPEPLGQFVSEVSNAIGCDASFVALPLLSALAWAIGDSRRLNVKSDWLVPSIIWTAVIGESGTAKSPAFRAVMKYPRQIQAEIQSNESEIREKYLNDRDVFEAELKHWKGKRLYLSGAPRPIAPTEPRLARTTVGDATMEGLVEVLESNPKGVLAAYDELAVLLGSFDKYRQGKGSDSATWLSIYNGESITVDRKGAGHTFIPSAFASIAGCIQPGVLPICFSSKERDAGMMARFAMANPPRAPKRWNENDISREIDSRMCSLFAWLFQLQPSIAADAKRTPCLFNMSDDAKQIWIEFYNRHNEEALNRSGLIAAAYSKLEELPLRLAIVFHCVKQHGGFASDHYIQADTMDAAITLTEWFKQESDRVYSLVSKRQDQTDCERLCDLISRRGGSITVRQLQRSNSKRYQSANSAEAALRELVNAGCGDWMLDDRASKQGRASKRFKLNE